MAQQEQAPINVAIFLTEEEFRQLDQLIGDIPTRFGAKLVSFFTLIGQKRAAEQKQFDTANGQAASETGEKQGPTAQ